MEMRVSEDTRNTHEAYIAKGLKNMRNSLKTGTHTPEILKTIAEEVDLWCNRMYTLTHGLKVYSIHALNRSEK